MIVVEDRFQFLGALQAWYPEHVEEVLPLLERAPVVTVMQCSAATAAGLRRYAFRARAFHTLLVDLRRSEEELWARLEKRTCRYQLNRAKKLAPTVMVNREFDAAYALIQDFIARRKFRPPMSRAEWARTVRCCDVFLALHEGRPIATHVVLPDAPRTARALISATADRADGAERSLVGALNRHLHWHEIMRYRDLGFTSYDLGGVVLDEKLAEHTIAEFKRGFGGEPATHHVLRLAGNPLLRTALRGVRAGWSLVVPRKSGEAGDAG